MSMSNSRTQYELLLSHLWCEYIITGVTRLPSSRCSHVLGFLVLEIKNKNKNLIHVGRFLGSDTIFLSY